MTTPTNSTTRRNATQPTDARMAAKRTVTYTINTAASKSTVNLAYAVAVNDQVLAEYARGVKKIRTDGAATIRVSVDSGQKVSLFLNSDAVPGRRNKPVYAVTPKDKNVLVTITEKMGKHNDPDTPVLAGSDKVVERYRAPLTGDIWMKITHKFTAADADALVPATTPAEAKAAVRSVYAGLPSGTLVMPVPSKGLTVTITFQDSDNPHENITKFSLTTDGLPRVHPATFAAAFTAAIDAKVSSLKMSSNWRPSLGSIAHRSGLGLDVAEVGGTRMLKERGFNNREIQLKAAMNAAKPGPAKEEARKAWLAEHNKNEPMHVQSFRASLRNNPGVKQLFDPWEMDADTTVAGFDPNRQNTGNEKLHRHHLHITARDKDLIA